MPVQTGPRVIFFGMQGDFSAPSLAALLASGIAVCAVVLPAMPLPGRPAPATIVRREQPSQYRTLLPLAAGRDIVVLAEQHCLPIWDVYRLGHAETLAVLAAYQPDIICVACWSHRIPSTLLALPRLGCLNVHPGLLPANRGPLPLFWTLRLGESDAGVTIHLLTERLDSGDILAQETIPLDEGISYEDLEARCAVRGAALLVRSVWELYENRASRRSQDEAMSSYYGAPGANDFIIPVLDWDARRVYNFVRGLRNWEQPLTLLTTHAPLTIRTVVSYSLEEVGDDSEENVESLSSSFPRIIHCRKGWVRVS